MPCIFLGNISKIFCSTVSCLFPSKIFQKIPAIFPLTVSCLFLKYFLPQFFLPIFWKYFFNCSLPLFWKDFSIISSKISPTSFLPLYWQAFSNIFSDSFLPPSWQCSLVSLLVLCLPMLLLQCLRCYHSHHHHHRHHQHISFFMMIIIKTNIFNFSWWVKIQLEFSLTCIKRLGLVRFILP